MKKIKLLPLLSMTLVVVAFTTSSCADITQQFNFTQDSGYKTEALSGNNEFDSLDHASQLNYIQNYNNNVNYVINDFVCWIRQQITSHFFTSTGEQYIDQYTGSITVSAQSANANKFNVSLMINFGQVQDIVLKSWYNFAGQQEVPEQATWHKIPSVQYFNLTFTQPTLSIKQISRNDNINYVAYASTDESSQFSLSFKDNKIIPTTYNCTDNVKSISLNTYTYKNWVFKNS